MVSVGVEIQLDVAGAFGGMWSYFAKINPCNHETESAYPGKTTTILLPSNLAGFKLWRRIDLLPTLITSTPSNLFLAFSSSQCCALLLSCFLYIFFLTKSSLCYFFHPTSPPFLFFFHGWIPFLYTKYEGSVLQTGNNSPLLTYSTWIWGGGGLSWRQLSNVQHGIHS